MSIALEKLQAVRKIVTHAKCPDGIASAMILRDVYPTAPIQFVQYNTTDLENLQAEPGLLFCDMSPPYQKTDRIEEFISAGAIVLDHHRTARDVVDRFGDSGIFGDEAKEPGVSGAVLAYRHVWLPMCGPGEDTQTKAMVEDFALLAGIRDTWLKAHPRWPEAMTQAYALMFPPVEDLTRNHSRLASRLGADWSKYLWAGRIREAAFRRTCERAVKDGFRFVSLLGGVRVVVFQGVKLTSDAAEFAADLDLVVGYDLFCEDGQPKVVYSLRSRTTFDCAALARYMGGGGHTKAAGFSVTGNEAATMSPLLLIEKILERYELTQ